MRKYLHQALLGSNKLWQYVVVTALAFVGYFIGQLPMLFALWRSIDSNPEIGVADITDFASNPDFRPFGITPNTGFLLLLLTFVFAFVLFYFGFTFIHGRRFKSLITTLSKIRWSRVFFGFSLWVALTLAVESVFYFLSPQDYTFHFEFKTFVPLVILCVIILPIQTSFEELFFRGYLMQGIGSISKYPWIPLLITTILFASIHGSNPEVTKFGFMPMMIYYVSAGLFLGLITLLDDSLELALGVHFATNFFGAALLGYSGAAIQTDSLFKTSVINPSTMTIGFLAAAAVFILICQYLYKWKTWSYLFSDISLKREELTSGTGLELNYTYKEDEIQKN